MHVPGVVFGLIFCLTVVSIGLWTFGKLDEGLVKPFVVAVTTGNVGLNNVRYEADMGCLLFNDNWSLQK